MKKHLYVCMAPGVKCGENTAPAAALWDQLGLPSNHCIYIFWFCARRQTSAEKCATPVLFNNPAKGFPWKFVTPDEHKPKNDCSTRPRQKLDIFSCFDRIHECDRRTDGRTDGQQLITSTALAGSTVRWKTVWSSWKTGQLRRRPSSSSSSPLLPPALLKFAPPIQCFIHWLCARYKLFLWLWLWLWTSKLCVPSAPSLLFFE